MYMYHFSSCMHESPCVLYTHNVANRFQISRSMTYIYTDIIHNYVFIDKAFNGYWDPKLFFHTINTIQLLGDKRFSLSFCKWILFLIGMDLILFEIIVLVPSFINTAFTFWFWFSGNLHSQCCSSVGHLWWNIEDLSRPKYTYSEIVTFE